MNIVRIGNYFSREIKRENAISFFSLFLSEKFQDNNESI